MIIEYQGTTVEVTKQKVKAWVEAHPAEDWAGMTCDGEQCLLHNYVMDQLPRRPFVFVGAMSIGINGLSYLVDDEAGELIAAFDGSDPDREGKDFTYGEVLALFNEQGIW